MPAAEEPTSGMNSVVDNICRLPPDLFTETSQHILVYLQGQTSGIDSAEISHKYLQAGVGLNHEAQQDIIRFLLLTFREVLQEFLKRGDEEHAGVLASLPAAKENFTASKNIFYRFLNRYQHKSAGQRNISADELVSKLEEGSLKWSKASLQVLHRLWSEQGAAVHAQQEVQAALRIGQVVDVQWRLGMAVSSDICRSLNSPYVTLLLKVAEPSGLICQKSFEMSVPQFQNFHKQFKEMAALMETV